jgi:hypothetical protein
MRRHYSRELADVDIAVVGVPCDLATSFRPGARFGPSAIRKASIDMAWWDKQFFWDFNPFNRLAIVDYGDGRYLLQASTPIGEFNEFFETSIKNDDFDTVAGMVIAGFTYLPEQMSEISLHGFQFKVLKTDSRRLHLLEATRLKQDQKD